MFYFCHCTTFYCLFKTLWDVFVIISSPDSLWLRSPFFLPLFLSHISISACTCSYRSLNNRARAKYVKLWSPTPPPPTFSLFFVTHSAYFTLIILRYSATMTSPQILRLFLLFFFLLVWLFTLFRADMRFYICFVILSRIENVRRGLLIVI